MRLNETDLYLDPYSAPNASTSFISEARNYYLDN
jgi:hypothetical protein